MRLSHAIIFQRLMYLEAKASALPIRGTLLGADVWSYLAGRICSASSILCAGLWYKWTEQKAVRGFEHACRAHLFISALGFEAAKGARSSPGVHITGSGDGWLFAWLLGCIPCVEQIPWGAWSHPSTPTGPPVITPASPKGLMGPFNPSDRSYSLCLAL